MKILILLLPFLVACATYKQPVYEEVWKSNKIKMCFIGDTGNNSFVQGEVAKLLEKENCDSVHFVGDIIYPHGIKYRHDKEFQKKFWDYYQVVTETGHKPTLYVVLGNHDHEGSVEAWTEVSKKYPKMFFPYPYYFVKLNNVCLTHFDTQYYHSIRTFLMAHEQNKWLKSINKELKGCDHKIALAHHPYVTPKNHHHESTGQMKKALKKYVVGKYDYYIAGHDHTLADMGVKDGTHLLISGAGGKHDYGKAGFLVIEVDGKNTNYHFRELSSSK